MLSSSQYGLELLVSRRLRALVRCHLPQLLGCRLYLELLLHLSHDDLVKTVRVDLLLEHSSSAGLPPSLVAHAWLDVAATIVNDHGVDELRSVVRPAFMLQDRVFSGESVFNTTIDTCIILLGVHSHLARGHATMVHSRARIN